MKRNKKKVTIVSILVLVLMLIGGSALYAHFGFNPHGGFLSPEEHLNLIRDRLTKQLDLDAAQQQELETIAREFLEKGEAMHQLRKTAREEALGILREDSLDRERIEQLAALHRDEISGFITEAAKRVTDFVSILTPEQREKLATAIEEHAEGCRHARWH